MSKTVSPLAPKTVPTLPPIEGVRIATAEAGIRYKHRTDVLYVTFARDTAVAGVLTRSKCPSAPVDWCRKNLAEGRPRAPSSSIPATPMPSRARRAPRP